MRSRLGEFGFLPLAVLLVVAAVPAGAGDRVYADGYDNLVIESRGGHKRILVGKGHLAPEPVDYERPRARPVYDDGLPTWCRKPAVLLKGRSYMYGLSDGELPDLPGKLCHFRQRAAPGAAIRRVQP